VKLNLSILSPPPPAVVFEHGQQRKSPSSPSNMINNVDAHPPEQTVVLEHDQQRQSFSVFIDFKQSFVLILCTPQLYWNMINNANPSQSSVISSNHSF
jgi:hypothetical protein